MVNSVTVKNSNDEHKTRIGNRCLRRQNAAEQAQTTVIGECVLKRDGTGNVSSCSGVKFFNCHRFIRKSADTIG